MYDKAALGYSLHGQQYQELPRCNNCYLAGKYPNLFSVKFYILMYFVPWFEPGKKLTLKTANFTICLRKPGTILPIYSFLYELI